MRHRWWLFVWALVMAAGAPPVSAARPPGGGGGGEPIEPVILDQGKGWSLINTRGFAEDDGQYFDRNVYLAQGYEGAGGLPLTGGLYENVVVDADSGDTTFILDETIVRELAQSEAQGYLTPYLQSIAEPEDPDDGGGGEWEVSGTKGGGGGDSLRPLFGRCKNKEVKKSKSFNLAQPINLWSQDFGGGFSGSLDLIGNANGSITGEISVELKRYAVFGLCVPYGVKFNHVRAFGSLSALASATLSGTVSYTKSWDWPIAKPHLFTFTIMIGPVPVIIGVNLPISVGLDLNASISGQVGFGSNYSAQGGFDYSCNFDGCWGGNTFIQNGGNGSPSLTAAITGRIQPSIWAQVAVRGYLYGEWLAYAQVGARPYLYGDLWGYYGNNCGDADGNGLFETVDALTFDLDWDLRITAQAKALWWDPKNWDLGGIGRRHLGFWDLLDDSDALTPMLGASTPVPAQTSQRYDARMRPCWPYGDNVTYDLNWGDGSNVGLTGNPRMWVSANKTWPAPGFQNVTLTALRDAHGRVLNAPTARTIEVTGAARRGLTWTKVSHHFATGTDKFNCSGCDPYVGNSLCTESHPVLCLRTDGSANPGLSIGFYDGWIGGNVGLTAPIRGDQLLSSAGADAVCAAAFGPGWVMAPFHHPQGGWGWSSRGNVTAGPNDRLWVRIDNQPANCWN